MLAAHFHQFNYCPNRHHDHGTNGNVEQDRADRTPTCIDDCLEEIVDPIADLFPQIYRGNARDNENCTNEKADKGKEKNSS